MSIAWCPWSAETFARARAGSMPVLLSIHTSWCRGCREMDRTSYADPRVIGLLRDRFVPVRVDADARPDVAERYAPDGVPATLFLTGAGDLLGGGTFVPPQRLAEALTRLADTYPAVARDLPAGVISGSGWTETSSRASTESLREGVFAAFDHEHGGFGADAKFPLPAPIELALEEWLLHGDSAMRVVAERSLDAMAAGLHDPVDGGFFHYAATRDWREPHVEKLLSVNADLLRLYAEAASALESPRYAEIAASVVRYAHVGLAQPSGGWGVSQASDDGYYASGTAEARRTLRAPAVDPAIYTGANGLMISAMLRAGEVLEDPDASAAAVEALEHLLVSTYRPGAGVAHQVDGEVELRGLLADQLAVAAAALDAAEATGRVPYLMIAEELVRFAMRTMLDRDRGGFFDRAPLPAGDRIGLLASPLKPFHENCQAVIMLVRLAASSHKQEFADRARETLRWLAPAAGAQGVAAAHYLLALRAASLL